MRGSIILHTVRRSLRASGLVALSLAALSAAAAANSPSCKPGEALRNLEFLRLRAQWATVAARCAGERRDVDFQQFSRFLSRHKDLALHAEESAGRALLPQRQEPKEWQSAGENHYALLIHKEELNLSAEGVTPYCERRAEDYKLSMSYLPTELNTRLINEACSNSRQAQAEASQSASVEPSTQTHKTAPTTPDAMALLIEAHGKVRLFAEKCAGYFSSEFNAHELYDRFLNSQGRLVKTHTKELTSSVCPSLHSPYSTDDCYNAGVDSQYTVELQKLTQESGLAYCERRSSEFLYLANSPSAAVKKHDVVQTPRSGSTPVDN